MRKFRSKLEPTARRLNGIVLRYDAKEGVGYITSNYGDIAVAKKDILTQPQMLWQSQEVVFDLYDEPNFSYAAHVTYNSVPDFRSKCSQLDERAHQPRRAVESFVQGATASDYNPANTKRLDETGMERYDLVCRLCQQTIPLDQRTAHEQKCNNDANVLSYDGVTQSIRCLPTAPAGTQEQHNLHPYNPNHIDDNAEKLYPSLAEYQNRDNSKRVRTKKYSCNIL